MDGRGGLRRIFAIIDFFIQLSMLLRLKNIIVSVIIIINNIQSFVNFLFSVLRMSGQRILLLEFCKELAIYQVLRR